MGNTNTNQRSRSLDRPRWAIFGVAAVLAPVVILAITSFAPSLFPTKVASLVAMVATCFLVAFLFGRPRNERGAGAPRQLARSGLRVGVIAFLSAAASLAFMWLLGDLKVIPNWFGRDVRWLYVTMGFSVLPCALFSIWGIQLKALVRPLQGEDPGQLDDTADQRPNRRRGQLIFGLVVLGGIASPALSPLLSKLRSPDEGNLALKDPALDPVEPTPAIEPLTAPEPEPKFRFVPPDGLESANPRQFHIAEVRRIEGAEPGQPVSLAPDNRLVAFTAMQIGIQHIRVVDLHSLEDVCTFPNVVRPRSIAWSPDSKRLAILREHPSEPLGIADLDSGSITWLPRPVGTQLPNASPDGLIWWQPNRIGIVGRQEAILLDLETLDVKTLRGEDVDDNLEELLGREEILNLKRAGAHGRQFPGNEVWRFERAASPQTVNLGVRPGEPLTTYSDRGMLTIRHNTLDCFQPLTGSPDSENSKVLLASDASLLLSLANGGLSVCFLGLRENPPTGMVVKTDIEPDEAVMALISQNKLAAIICRPLRNPLTGGTTVNGDLIQIRALARVREWKDGEIAFWIDAEHEPVSTEDAVACFCSYETGKLTPLPDEKLQKWWSIIGEFSSDPRCTPPEYNYPWLKKAGAADAPVDKVAPAEVVKTTPPVGSGVEPKTEAPPAASPKPAPKPKPKFTETSLINFIGSHHGKYGRKDAAGLAADFTPQAVYMNYGKISRQRIAEIQAGIFGRVTALRHEFSGNVKFTPSGNDQYVIEYDLKSTTTMRGRTGSEMLRLRVVISTSSGSPQIIEFTGRPINP